jgi:hypothetical protein
MTFASSLSQLSIARAATRQTQTDLLSSQERLKKVESLIQASVMTGLVADPSLISEKNTLINTDIPGLQAQLQTNLQAERGEHQNLLGGFDNIKKSIEELSDSLPVLLFPVRLETAFDINSSALLVRIYPDDLSVETHEPVLTESEINSGKDYWRNAIIPAQKAAAWDVLCRNFGAQRAAWIIKQLTPTNLASNPTNPASLVFPAVPSKFDSWTQQAHTRILPDFFVVTAYDDTAQTTVEGIGSLIDYSVKLGIDPQNSGSIDPQGADLQQEPSLQWMFDFLAAEAAGLGVRISLDSSQLANGFDRLIALGVKVSVSANETQTLTEELFDNHHYTSGLSLLRQGMPTSNTATVSAEHTRRDLEHSETLSAETGPVLFNPVAVSNQMRDGQVLADALGIDYSVFQHVLNSDGRDIQNARLLNSTLWQATGGYYLQDLLFPLVTSQTASAVRTFFTDFVIGGGTIPGLKIGKHPYGILTNSISGNITWPESEANKTTFSLIQNVSQTLRTTWSQLAANVNATSNTSADRQQVLIDMAAKLAISHDYYQRIGVSAGYVWNNLIFNGQSTEATQWRSAQITDALNVIAETGLSISGTPRILQTNFQTSHSKVGTPLVPPYSSTTSPIDALPGAGNLQNFIQWMSAATCADVQTHEFSAVTSASVDPPQSFLYRLFRQALLLEYYYASASMRGMSTSQLRESDLVNVLPAGQSIPAADGNTESIVLQSYSGRSRWNMLNQPLQGNPLSPVQLIDQGLVPGTAEELQITTYRDNLQALAQVPAAELERLTAQHIDTLSFRLDAWTSGLAAQRLTQIRNVQAAGETVSRNKGLFIGSYGWLENVKPRTAVNTVAPPTGNFSGEIEENPANEGFIHSPSVNHAVTAAVLRTGYLSRADQNRPDTLAVNLTSERVRIALQMIEASRNGIELAVSLGYYFEKSIHENYSSLLLTAYVQNFRNQFPHNKVSSVSGIEARDTGAEHVLDGLKFVRNYRAYLDTNYYNVPNNNSLNLVSIKQAYISSIPGLAGASTNQKSALVTEADRLEQILDALSDLGVAEGVFHTVQGNTVKAKAVMSAISNGKAIADPDVIKTPRTGTVVQNRIALNIPALLWNEESYSSGSSFDGYNHTPLSRANLSLNHWLKTFIGDPRNVRCKVTADGISTPIEVRLSELGLQPVDLLRAMNGKLKNDDSVIAKLIRKVVRNTQSLAESVAMTINYAEYVVPLNSSLKSFSDFHSLMNQTYRMIRNSRALRTKDFTAPGTEGITNTFNLTDAYNRFLVAEQAFVLAVNNLTTASASFVSFNLAVQQDFDNMRNSLLELSYFGIQNTIFESSTDVTEQTFNKIKESSTATLNECAKRTGLLAELAVASPQPNEDGDVYVEKIEKALKVILGDSNLFLPLYQETNETNSTLAFLNQNNNGSLLNDAPAGSFPVEEWIQGAARVRERVNDFELFTIIAGTYDLQNLDRFNLQPAQFPMNFDSTERWMAISVSSADKIRQNRLSMAVSYPPDFSTNSNRTGLMIDEWNEVIPNQYETTGVAFHFDQPESKPPQCMILAVSPVIQGKWNYQHLLGIVNNTLNEAKMRAVDYEQIGQTRFGQLLPAVVLPFTAENTTIGLTENQIN